MEQLIKINDLGVPPWLWKPPFWLGIPAKFGWGYTVTKSCPANIEKQRVWLIYVHGTKMYQVNIHIFQKSSTTRSFRPRLRKAFFFQLSLTPWHSEAAMAVDTKFSPIVWCLGAMYLGIPWIIKSMDWFVGENLNRKPSIFPVFLWGFPVNIDQGPQESISMFL